MPFRIRSSNPFVRVVSALAVAMSWWGVMAASLLIVLPFFGTFDTQAFLTGTKPNGDHQITNLEFALGLVILLGVNSLYSLTLRRLTKYANRKLKKNIEWENNPMG